MRATASARGYRLAEPSPCDSRRLRSSGSRVNALPAKLRDALRHDDRGGRTHLLRRHGSGHDASRGTRAKQPQYTSFMRASLQTSTPEVAASRSGAAGP